MKWGCNKNKKGSNRSPMDGDGSGLGVHMTAHLSNLDPHVPRQHRSGKRKIIDISFRQSRRLELLCNLNQPN